MIERALALTRRYRWCWLAAFPGVVLGMVLGMDAAFTVSLFCEFVLGMKNSSLEFPELLVPAFSRIGALCGAVGAVWMARVCAATCD